MTKSDGKPERSAAASAKSRTGKSNPDIETKTENTEQGNVTVSASSFPFADIGKQCAELVVLLKSRSWGYVFIFSVFMLIAILIVVSVSVASWGVALPFVWSWADEGSGFKTYLALTASTSLLIIPLAAFLIIPWSITFWKSYLEGEGELQRLVKTERDAQHEIEERLSKNDPHQMVLLLKYSRHMLSEYYAIGLTQAQRSFKYCLIAMWIGFAVLIVGVLDNLFPIAQILIVGLSSSSDVQIPKTGGAVENANTLILLTGAVIEFIAAAFLWVYRYSIQQLTYYYKRQLKLHNTLLAHRLACDTDKIKDEAIKLIIERLLVETEDAVPSLPSGAGFKKLVGQ